MSTSDELIKQREELNAKIDKALKAEKTNIALLFVNRNINILIFTQTERKKCWM